MNLKLLPPTLSPFNCLHLSNKFLLPFTDVLALMAIPIDAFRVALSLISQASKLSLSMPQTEGLLGSVQRWQQRDIKVSLQKLRIDLNKLLD